MSRSRASRLLAQTPGRKAVRALLAAGLAAAVGITGSSPAAAATCGTAEGFSRVSSGSLFRLSDPSILTGANSVIETGLVGRGWGGFAWIGAGGDGVVYALTTAGKLLWYRYQDGAWVAKSGSVVGVGFNPTTRVTNIAVGADGWIYVVRSDKRLVAFHHLGRLTGAASWVNSGGYVLGSGWTADELIAPQGDGVVYRQVAGNLFWYRHSDPSAGPVTWNNGGRGVRIGAGWRVYDLLPLGAGVLLATSAPSGQVSVYQHADPLNGGQGWTVAGRQKYLARADSFGVSFAPNLCS
jgi:hypothetical protein